MIKPITISPRAIVEIKHMMENKNIPEGYGLRVGIKGGGCGGMGYLLGFDKEKEGDITYNIDDVTVYIEKKHTMYLIGLEVDFYEGGDARGFTFVRPEEENKTHTP